VRSFKEWRYASIEKAYVLCACGPCFGGMLLGAVRAISRRCRLLLLHLHSSQYCDLRSAVLITTPTNLQAYISRHRTEKRSKGSIRAICCNPRSLATACAKLEPDSTQTRFDTKAQGTGTPPCSCPQLVGLLWRAIRYKSETATLSKILSPPQH